MTPSLHRIDPRLALTALVLICSGCRENPVTVYSVPHETPANPHAGGMPPANSTNAGGNATASRSAGPHLEWTKPGAWTEKPASQMRLASYAFTAPDGAAADISVFSFPDAAGGLLANVNRWRSQVGLAPVGENEMPTIAERTEIAGQISWLVDFLGTPTGAAAPMGDTPAPMGPTRIIGAIVPVGGTSWFFKMMGPDAVVASQRAAFKEMIASIRAVTPSATAAAPASSPAPSGASPLPTADSIMSGDVPPPPKAQGFTFDTPPGWQPQTPTSMRVASFLIPGPGVPAADVSVIVLAGTAGGDLANVNRWRGQLGLPEINAAELAKTATPVTSPSGTFQVVDLESTDPKLDGGHRARMLGAILQQGEKTWFVKATGEINHVATQREAFNQFLRSFRIEPGA